MKELLETLVKAIVENGDAVVITETVDAEGKVDLNIDCAESDRGLVVGKQGRNINSIRTLVKILAVKTKKFVTIHLKDDNNGGERREGGYQRRDDNRRPGGYERRSNNTEGFQQTDEE